MENYKYESLNSEKMIKHEVRAIKYAKNWKKNCNFANRITS